MTKDVITVSTDTSVPEIARTLLEHAISAVPVVDASGVPIGMVSEGDLIARNASDRDARHDWWLSLLAQREMPANFAASLVGSPKRACDLMSTPLITVEEETELADIADLLKAHRIKRVPVVHQGRLVGIVSRADILRALSDQMNRKEEDHGIHADNFISKAFARLDEEFIHRATHEQEPVSSQVQTIEHDLSAADFRRLVVDFENKKDRERDATKEAASRQHRERVKDLVTRHFTDKNWQELLHSARRAAERGEKECLLMRFPSEVCADGGRAINVTDPDWPSTLRGEPAELYWYWDHELRPRGFHLMARIIEFPNGLPGDIGLFLTWGG